MAIEVLDQRVANQIAAGEVVNRPCSVVKELMENAIDAGATDIQLVVKDAGRTLVQVVDNGCGMDEKDAERCFLPHATSKIRNEADLYNIHTMGFRGEALASIASIAQVELKTRREQDQLGTKVEIEGGEIKRMSQTACPKGTSVAVGNIFYNTPARRNFLKSDAIENNHISEEFIRIALVNTSVSFTYYNNNKVVYKLEKTNLKKRIGDLFGHSVGEKLLPIHEEIDLVKINGYVCKEDLCRKSKNQQYFFVNNRYVKSPYFANAVDRAYANLIPEKTYPIFFIHLTLDPKNIDVNIHPTKTEVKFLDERVIYAVLHAAAKKSIGQFSLASKLDFSDSRIEFPIIQKNTPLPQIPKVNFDSNFNPFEQKSSKTDYCKNEYRFSKSRQYELIPDDKTPAVARHNHPLQLSDSYIVTVSNDSLLIVDQKRASEKIIYDKILKQQPLGIESQRLLSPYRHLFAPNISFQLVEFIPLFKNYGIEMEYDKTDGSFNILAKPVGRSMEECIEFMEDFVRTGNETGKDQPTREERALKMARKLSLPYGKSLSQEEMETLLAQLFSLPDCTVGPDNKKVISRVSLVDVEKLFEQF